MLTLIELPYKFWKWHNLQRSWNTEHFLYREHEIQKGGPQIMTSWYGDVFPGMLSIVGDGGDDVFFDLPYACIGEKSDGHAMFSFVLKFRWGIGDGRAHR